MKIDTEIIEKTLKKMAEDTRGACCESSVFIGEIDGKPVKLTVMQKTEAEDAHDYEGTRPEYDCLYQ